MSEVLLDTGAAFALVRHVGTPKQQPFDRTDWPTGGVEAAIGALLLHDRVFLDGCAVERNARGLHALRNLADVCELVRLDEVQEERIYHQAFTLYLDRLREPVAGCNDLFRMHTQEWMALELAVEYCNPSAGWDEIEWELGGLAERLAEGLRHQFGTHTPYSGAACMLLLRLFYHERLQHACGLDLALHPLREYRKTPDDFVWQPAYAGDAQAVYVVDLFDDAVRESFRARNQRYLGGPSLALQVPPFTSMVLRDGGGADFWTVLRKMRDSPPVVAYRTGLNALREALAQGDSHSVETARADLEALATAWQKHSPSEQCEEIHISVPILSSALDPAFASPERPASPERQRVVFTHVKKEEEET